MDKYNKYLWPNYEHQGEENTYKRGQSIRKKCEGKKSGGEYATT